MIDSYMLSKWETMLEVVDKNAGLCHYKLPLLYMLAGELQGYGLAHPTPGKLTAAWRMAERIKNIAWRLEFAS